MIKAVIFDFGGVLSREGAAGFAEEQIAQILGIDRGKVSGKIKNAFWAATLGQITDTEFWDKAAELAGVPPSDDFQAKWEKVEGRVTDRLVKGYFDLAGELRAAGVKTGVMSNLILGSVPVIRKAGGYDGFDPVVLSCEVGLAKPDQRIYQMLLERLRLRPEEVLFIDDREENVEGARKAGIHAIKAGAPDETIEKIRKITATLRLLEKGVGA